MFDGKIGLWPFVSYEPAKRGSKIRKAGTVETNPLRVTRDVYTDYLLNKVFPAIREKFPFQRHTDVLVQQENARSHVRSNDRSVLWASRRGNQKITMVNQPPNSPDFNVSDLGIFHSIQSTQNSRMSSSLMELVASVHHAFKNYSSEKLSNVFLTLQSIYESTLSKYGNNNFQIQHSRKKHLRDSDKSELNWSEVVTARYIILHCIIIIYTVLDMYWSHLEKCS